MHSDKIDPNRIVSTALPKAPPPPPPKAVAIAKEVLQPPTATKPVEDKKARFRAANTEKHPKTSYKKDVIEIGLSAAQKKALKTLENSLNDLISSEADYIQLLERKDFEEKLKVATTTGNAEEATKYATKLSNRANEFALAESSLTSLCLQLRINSAPLLGYPHAKEKILKDFKQALETLISSDLGLDLAAAKLQPLYFKFSDISALAREILNLKNLLPLLKKMLSAEMEQKQAVKEKNVLRNDSLTSLLLREKHVTTLGDCLKTPFLTWFNQVIIQSNGKPLEDPTLCRIELRKLFQAIYDQLKANPDTRNELAELYAHMRTIYHALPTYKGQETLYLTNFFILKVVNSLFENPRAAGVVYPDPKNEKALIAAGREYSKYAMAAVADNEKQPFACLRDEILGPILILITEEIGKQ